MTDYDPPGITNPENVDALTHQQIKDAFDAIENATHDMVTNWGHARAMWRDSTTALVQAVRSAVDGKWTGAAADSAAMAVTRYGGRAEELVALFEKTASVVVNTATTAVMTKSFLPPVVQVTADQKTDPVEYDRQTREADTAQAEARRIMQERYVVGFMHQDTKLPTYPPAVSPVSDGPALSPATGPTPPAAPAGPSGANQEDAPVAGQPNDSATPSADAPVQNSPDQTQAAATEAQPAATTSPTSDSSRPDTPRTSPNAPNPAQPSNPAITPGVAPSGGPSRPGGRPNLGSGIGSNTRVPSNTGSPPGPGVSRPAVPTTPPGLTPAAAASGTSASGTPARPSGAPAMMPPGAGRGKDEEREKKDKKVDLTHESNTVELLGKTKYVPPTIGS